MAKQIFQYKSIEEEQPGGIYLELNGCDRLVLPKMLYETLWDCYTRRRLCHDVEVKFQIFPDEVVGYFFDYSKGYYSIEFDREAFVASAKESLRLFCKDVLNFIPTVYGEDYFGGGHAERMVEGLEAMAIPRNYSQLFSADVKVEDFTFKFVDDYGVYTGFVIGFGNRIYRSCLSDWSNDLEVIRHQIEGMVLYKSAEVQIFMEDSPNTISIEHTYIHDSMASSCVKVTFTPDEFVGGPILWGYCDRYQVIKSIYEAFLSLALTFPLESNDGEPTRQDAYNMLKSPIIERFCKTSNRQQRVKDVILINPDYDNCFAHSLLVDCADYTIEPDGILDEDLYDKDGKPIVLPELYEWQQEIEPIVIASETGKPYEKDWVDYHRRGLEIAHKLRKELSTDFDLWYKAPFEDKSGTIDSEILVL